MTVNVSAVMPKGGNCVDSRWYSSAFFPCNAVRRYVLAAGGINIAFSGGIDFAGGGKI